MKMLLTSCRAIKAAAVASVAMVGQFAAAHPGHAQPGLMHDMDHAVWLVAGAMSFLVTGLLWIAKRRRG